MSPKLFIKLGSKLFNRGLRFFGLISFGHPKWSPQVYWYAYLSKLCWVWPFSCITAPWNKTSLIIYNIIPVFNYIIKASGFRFKPIFTTKSLLKKSRLSILVNIGLCWKTSRIFLTTLGMHSSVRLPVPRLRPGAGAAAQAGGWCRSSSCRSEQEAASRLGNKHLNWKCMQVAVIPHVLEHSPGVPAAWPTSWHPLLLQGRACMEGKELLCQCILMQNLKCLATTHSVILHLYEVVCQWLWYFFVVVMILSLEM